MVVPEKGLLESEFPLYLEASDIDQNDDAPWLRSNTAGPENYLSLSRNTVIIRDVGITCVYEI